MPTFPRTIMPNVATRPSYPGPLKSIGHTGKANVRSTLQRGMTWEETFPPLRVGDPDTEALISFITEHAGLGTILTTTHPFLPGSGFAPNGVGGGAPVVVGQRTNLLLRSEEFDNAAWTNIRSTDAANTVAAPDGTTTADTLIEDSTASASHFIQQAVTKAASAVSYVLSVHVKAKERSKFLLKIQGTVGTDGVTATFDLSAGTATAAVATGNFTAGVSDIISLGDGWFRCWITCTSNTDTTITSAVFLDAGSGTSYTGDGSSGLYIWGAQLTPGTGVLQSYKKTTTVAVTSNESGSEIVIGSWTGNVDNIVRAGDHFRIAGLNTLFRATADADSKADSTATLKIHPAITVGESQAANALITRTSAPIRCIIDEVLSLPSGGAGEWLAGLKLRFREVP